jgi:hypothetical protein
MADGGQARVRAFSGALIDTDHCQRLILDGGGAHRGEQPAFSSNAARASERAAVALLTGMGVSNTRCCHHNTAESRHECSTYDPRVKKR